MKFFHWDKQCKQEIERYKQLLHEQDVKHQVALKGIDINEKVADELRTQLAQLEIENKYLKAQLANSNTEQGTIIYQAPELKETKKKRIEAK